MTGSGISAQVGMAAESTFGTGVTVTRFAETDNWKPKPNKNIYQSSGLAAGLFVDRSSRRVETSRSYELSFSVDVLARSFGLMFRQLFGSTAAPVQQAATTAYLQTHTLADLLGISSTIQAGEPSTDGTVNPYTYLGCRAKTFEFTQEVDKALSLQTTWDAKDRTEATALASASYSAAVEQPFHWGGFLVKAHNTYGSEAAISGITKLKLKIDRKQHVGWYADGTGRHAQPVLNDKSEVITGTLSSDFVDKTILRDRFAAETGFALLLQWTGDLIASTYYEQLTIRLPKCFLDTDGTEAKSDEVLMGDFDFTALSDGTNPPISLLYQCIDTTL
jgi:hypothetical protein